MGMVVVVVVPHTVPNLSLLVEYVVVQSDLYHELPPGVVPGTQG